MADEDTKPTDGTVADLQAHLDNVTDPAEVEQLKQEEADGKDRATAHAALDAKAAELSSDTADEHPAPGTDANADGNVTEAAADDDEKVADDAAVTVVAQAPNPEALSDDDINSISGDGLKEGASQQQRDVAQGLVEMRDGKDPETVNPHATGPGSDIA